MKKLSDYIMELGRPVAYYPKLKRITGSTTGTILICQLLYWTDKTSDGWVYKDANEIEEETGLTVSEQRTAKKALFDLGLVEIERKRLDHTTRYKINQDRLNELWGAETGKEVKPIPTLRERKEKEQEKREPRERKTLPDGRITQANVKGDLVDAILDHAASPAVAKINRIEEIRRIVRKKLTLNPTGKAWDSFVEYAYKQEKEGEQFERFVEWLLTDGDYNPIYWSPNRMQQLWPQAFVSKNGNDPDEEFVKPLPDLPEEDYVEMPSEIRKRRI